VTEPTGDGLEAHRSGRDSRLRSTAVFAFWTAISRLAGLAREIIAAALFGTRGSINAFVIAFQIPNLVRSLVADAALSAAFIPAFTELEERGEKEAAGRLASALAGLITLGLGAVALVGVLLAPVVLPLLPWLDDELVDEIVWLTQILFPIVPLLGLTGLVMAVLQTRDRFGPTAFAPVLWNALIIGALIAAAFLESDTARIAAYAIGIVVGTAGQLAFLVPFLGEGGWIAFPRRLWTEHVKHVLVLMLPVTLGLGLINVNLAVDAFVAPLADAEAPRAIDAAFRLYLLPQGIFSVAVATVLFPTIARMAARGDRSGLRDAISDGLRQIFAVLIPASLGLLLLAEPIVRLVFQRGEFTAHSSQLTSESLMAFSVGLAFNGASLLVVRAFFGLQRPWRPTAVAGLGAALNLGLDLVLYRPLGVAGIPLSTSIVSAVTFGVLLWLLARELGGVRGRWVVGGSLRSLAAAVPAAALAWIVWWGLDELLGRAFLAQVVSLGVAMLAGTAVLLALWRAFGVSDLRVLARVGRSLR
jgi:putative peptidoglycan lipid II flippase